jgi:hypothetical protein
MNFNLLFLIVCLTISKIGAYDLFTQTTFNFEDAGKVKFNGDDFIYSSDPFPLPIPYRDGNLWGYCLGRTKFLTPAIFDTVRYFWDGRAAVKLNGSWGIIDTTGKFIVFPKYTEISDYCNELIIGFSNDTLIFYNSFGDSLSKIIGPFEYTRMENCYNHILPIQIKGKYRFFNVDKGEYSYVSGYDSPFLFYRNLISIGKEKFGVFNFVSGDTIIPEIYDKPIWFSNDRGLIIKNGKVGFIAINGGIIVPPKYEECTIDGPDDHPNGTLPYNEGFARVELNGKYGYINLKGDQITEIKYDYAENFHYGLGVVEIKSRYSVIDTNGQELFEFMVDFHQFCEKHIELLNSNDLYKKHQESVYDTIQFDRDKYQFITPYLFGFYRINYNGRGGFVDYTGYEYFKN